MQNKMDAVLEAFKLERAEAVWRKRMAGIDKKGAMDMLTDEAKVAQVEVQMAKMQSEALHTELSRLLGKEVKPDVLQVVRAMAADPHARMADIAKIAKVNLDRVKYLSQILQNAGVIIREGTKRCSQWKNPRLG